MATAASRSKTKRVSFSDQVKGFARDGDSVLTAKDKATDGLRCKSAAKEKQPPPVKRKVRWGSQLSYLGPDTDAATLVHWQRKVARIESDDEGEGANDSNNSNSPTTSSTSSGIHSSPEGLNSASAVNTDSGSPSSPAGTAAGRQNKGHAAADLGAKARAALMAKKSKVS